MKKEDFLYAEGKIENRKGHSCYTVRLFNGREVMARVAGRSWRVTKYLLPGVEVRVELSPYDLSRGRIVGLHKPRG